MVFLLTLRTTQRFVDSIYPRVLIKRREREMAVLRQRVEFDWRV